MARMGGFTDEKFRRLIAGAQAGDETCFAALWRNHNPALVRFLAGTVGPDDAEDVGSAVWLEVVRGLDRFDGDQAGFRGWLFTIARSRSVDLHRHRQRRPPRANRYDDGDDGDRQVGHDLDPAEVVEAASATDRAVALIGSLPPDQAEVVLLRVVADLDVATVARLVGKRPGTVRVLAHRGLRRLAELLQVEADALPDVTR
jgi:RNA polymerase sigma-70 factor, ECF subfamily